MILCDGNYGLCAYGMDSVHNREPERSRVTIYKAFDSISQVQMFDILSEMGFPKASRRSTGSALQ